jgi:hypothetical protein
MLEDEFSSQDTSLVRGTEYLPCGTNVKNREEII